MRQEQDQVYCQEVVNLCAQTAQRAPFWIQAQGGNISVKHDGILYIKPSGFRFQDVLHAGCVALASCEVLTRALSYEPQSAAQGELHYAQALRQASLNGKKPSMESGFHAVLPHTYVIHLHALSALVVVYLLEQGSGPVRDLLEAHFGVRYTVCDFLNPGRDLSVLLGQQQDRAIFFLKNHGIVLASDDAGDILRQWENFEQAFFEKFPQYAYEDIGDEALLKTPAVLKRYFPDAGVFWDKLLGYVSPEGFLRASVLQDSNAYELWQALLFLNKVCPQLAEIEESQFHAIAHLPTEKERISHAHSN